MRYLGTALCLAAMLMIALSGKPARQSAFDAAAAATAGPRPPAPFFSPSHVKICADFTGSGQCGDVPLDIHAVIGNSNPPWQIVAKRQTCDVKIVAWSNGLVHFVGSFEQQPAGTRHCDLIDYSFAVPNTAYTAEAKLTVEYTIYPPNTPPP